MHLIQGGSTDLLAEPLSRSLGAPPVQSNQGVPCVRNFLQQVSGVCCQGTTVCGPQSASSLAPLISSIEHCIHLLEGNAIFIFLCACAPAKAKPRLNYQAFSN